MDHDNSDDIYLYTASDLRADQWDKIRQVSEELIESGAHDGDPICCVVSAFLAIVQQEYLHEYESFKRHAPIKNFLVH